MPELLHRLVFTLLFLGALVVSGLHRRRARRASGTIPRRQEGRGLMAARLAGAAVLLTPILAYPIDPDWTAWARLPFPEWLRWSGAALSAVAMVWLHRTFQAIGANVSETIFTKGNHRLVTSGPYRRVRHPLYAGSLAWLIGLGVLASSAWILAAAALAFLGIAVLVVPREEAQLLARFGEAYQDYRRQTPWLLPRPRSAVR